MSLKIRLQRAGAKKNPFYRIVVADSKSPRDGKFIEKVGTYAPKLPKESGERVKLNQDRISFWLKNGATPSERVALFISKSGFANDNKVIKDAVKKRAKTIEVKKAQAEAKRIADELAAKKQAEAEAKAAAEAAAAEAAANAPAEAPAAETPAA
jgi:small subunit ribosomal protein S16